MLRFEEYLADFTNTINILDFVINMIVATILSMILKWFYIRFGKSLSNREKFASIFVPMTLSTLLIITVVQASIALSLGLVGALSIVRFRAAIKEPEELTYLFLVIGIGLTCGANKPLLALVAIAIILPLDYLNGVRGSKGELHRDKMFVNIKSQNLELSQTVEVLKNHMSYVELKRIDSGTEGHYMSFLGRSNTIGSIQSLEKALKHIDPAVEISIVDQAQLVL